MLATWVKTLYCRCLDRKQGVLIWLVAVLWFYSFFVCLQYSVVFIYFRPVDVPYVVSRLLFPLTSRNVGIPSLLLLQVLLLFFTLLSCCWLFSLGVLSLRLLRLGGFEVWGVLRFGSQDVVFPFGDALSRKVWSLGLAARFPYPLLTVWARWVWIVYYFFVRLFAWASALVPRGFIARPSRVISIYCDSKERECSQSRDV